ncbi:MAG: FG-GAP repeat protein [Myxococcota bacterium]
MTQTNPRSARETSPPPACTPGSLGARAARFALVFCAASVAACGGSDASLLRVNVRTDFAPGIDFGSIQVEAEDRIRRVDLRAGQNFLLGAEVATFDDLSAGDVRVRATLVSPGGAPLAVRDVLVRFSDTASVTVVLTRSCENQACAAGSSCNNGECVMDACSPETPDACGTSACSAAADCPSVEEACGALTCSLGECLFETRSCAGGEFCVPDRGCVASDLPEDAGVEPDMSLLDMGTVDTGMVDMAIADEGVDTADSDAATLDGGPVGVSPWPLTADAIELRGSRVGDDDFGSAVAISADGNVIAVGAPSDDSSERGIDPPENNDDLANAGAVYVFRRGGDGTWSEEAYLKPQSPDINANFGSSLSLSFDGSLLAVLVPQDRGTGIAADSDPFGTAIAPAVVLFRFEDGAWREDDYVRVLAASDGLVQLALDADCLLVSGSRSALARRIDGAWFVRQGANNVIGEAYLQSDCTRLMERSGTDSVRTSDVDPETLVPSGNFLTSPPEGQRASNLGWRSRLSRSGEILAASRPTHNSMATGDGTILIFSLGDRAWQPETTLRSNEPRSGGDVGRAMDMNLPGTRVSATEVREDNVTRIHYWEQDESPSRWSHVGHTDLEAARSILALAMDGEGNRVVVGDRLSDRIFVLE